MAEEKDNCDSHMSPSISLVNLSGLAKPLADVSIVLINKIDKAIGGALLPWQLRRGIIA